MQSFTVRMPLLAAVQYRNHIQILVYQIVCDTHLLTVTATVNNYQVNCKIILGTGIKLILCFRNEMLQKKTTGTQRLRSYDLMALYKYVYYYYYYYTFLIPQVVKILGVKN